MTTATVDPFEADIRREDCPTCHQRDGQPCVTTNGRALTEAHRSRERMWQNRRVRELNHRTAKPVDWNSPEWGGKVHVASGGDLAGEGHLDSGGGDDE